MARVISAERRAEQKAIKEICAHIRKREDLSWFAFLNDRIGLGVAEEYEKNFDSGEIGERRFALIKDWLLTHEPDLAYGMAPHLFPRSLQTQWAGLIETRGQYGQVHSRPYRAGSLHEISALNPINARIALGQDFTIEVESPIDGAVIALNRYRNEWYPLVLQREGFIEPISIERGLYGFPIQNGDLTQITLLRQSDFPGEHGHCFLIGPPDLMGYYAERMVPRTALTLPFLNTMAERLIQVEKTKLAVLLENVLLS